jgi:hypothetical protein
MVSALAGGATKIFRTGVGSASGADRFGTRPNFTGKATYQELTEGLELDRGLPQ